jgi:hypothetical protein
MIGTVEDAVIVGNPEVAFTDARVSAPMSAVQSVLELLIVKISTSLPDGSSGSGAQP